MQSPISFGHDPAIVPSYACTAQAGGGVVVGEFIGYDLRQLDSPSGECGLVFVGPSQASVERFLSAYVGAMYPPGDRGTSNLTTHAEPDCELVFEAYGGSSQVELKFTTIDKDTPRLVEQSIRDRGSIPILFGFRQGEAVTLLHPLRNHIVKTEAMVDGRLISGIGAHDWKPFLRLAGADFPTVEAVG